MSLKPRQTLDEYSKYFQVWLQECYNSRVHGSLKTTPEISYKSSQTALRFVAADVIANAFRRVEKRKVDKAGCISFYGRKYEVGVAFIGRQIGVAYDPADTSELMAEPEHGEPFRIKELVIGPHSGRRPKLPQPSVKAENSRFLDEKEKLYETRKDTSRRAIRYSEFAGKGGESDV